MSLQGCHNNDLYISFGEWLFLLYLLTFIPLSDSLYSNRLASDFFFRSVRSFYYESSIFSLVQTVYQFSVLKFLNQRVILRSRTTRVIRATVLLLYSSDKKEIERLSSQFSHLKGLSIDEGRKKEEENLYSTNSYIKQLKCHIFLNTS